MKVRDLIEILESCEPDADVLLMTQRNWPFENTCAGVTVRGEFQREGQDELEGTDDVFLVEGEQLRYGSKDAWNTACLTW